VHLYDKLFGCTADMLTTVTFVCISAMLKTHFREFRSLSARVRTYLTSPFAVSVFRNTPPVIAQQARLGNITAWYAASEDPAPLSEHYNGILQDTIT
jgi:hypothetical protein